LSFYVNKNNLNTYKFATSGEGTLEVYGNAMALYNFTDTFEYVEEK